MEKAYALVSIDPNTIYTAVGTNIGCTEAFQEAVCMAKAANRKIYFAWNGIIVDIDPNTSVQEAMSRESRYRAEFQTASKANEEAIKAAEAAAQKYRDTAKLFSLEYVMGKK